MKTLLVDGDNLLTIGYFGLKNFFYKGRHVGAIYHFMNTLRKQFDEHNLDKIVVFWDGDDSAIQRKRIYPHYKENRKARVKTEEELENYAHQRHRVKQYLEELYVRQAEFAECECDDCIAYYVHKSPSEEKIIFSSDKDLVQLIDETTVLYNPTYRQIFKLGDSMEYNKQQIRVENILLAKIMCGDPSDCIYGIKNFGIKRLIGLVPEIITEVVTMTDFRERVNLLHEEDKHNKTIQNLLTGVTKFGVYGDEFFEINTKIVDLTEPFLTEEAELEINDLISERMDGEGRSYKNTMKMMIADGMFNFLPKRDDAWVNFLKPFLKLTTKEKNRIIKKRNYIKKRL